jgi:hypothetical protein
MHEVIFVLHTNLNSMKELRQRLMRRYEFSRILVIFTTVG